MPTFVSCAIARAAQCIDGVTAPHLSFIFCCLFLFVYFVCLFLSLFLYLFLYLFISLSLYVFLYLSIHLFLNLFLYLVVCSCVCWFACMFLSFSVFLFLFLSFLFLCFCFPQKACDSFGQESRPYVSFWSNEGRPGHGHDGRQRYGCLGTDAAQQD